MTCHTKSTLTGLTKDERKRNSDRVSQRALRERKKDRMQHLERTVEQLQNQNADGNVQLLINEIERLKEEKETLKRQVNQLSGVIPSLQQESDSAEGERFSISGTATAVLASSEAGNFLAEVGPGRNPLFVDISRGYEKLKARPDITDMLRDTHTILKATLNGWHSIVRTEANPLQDILENLHERLDLGPKSRLIDQLSVYYLTQMALLVLEDLESSINIVPFWLHPTETQKAVHHHLIIGMLPWPSMRDHVVHNPSVRFLERDCEAFTLEFLRCIRFVPQINFETSFTVNEFSGRLSISRTYRHLFFDSPPFAMTPEFFTKFSEFKDMIPEWKVPQTNFREGEGSVVVHSQLSGRQNGDTFNNDSEWPIHSNMGDQGEFISAAPGYCTLEMSQNMPDLDLQSIPLELEYLEWL